MRALLLVALVLAGCIAPFGTAPAPRALTFHAPTDASAGTDGAEPSLAIDSTGRIFITSMHIEKAFPYLSNVFRSVDEGATWERLDPNQPIAGDKGAGGGDESIAIAPDDSIYVTDLSGQGSTSLTSHDHGATWIKTLLSTSGPVFLEDREWNTVDHEGRAYIVGRDYLPGATAWVTRSDDGGKTFMTVGSPWNAATGPDGMGGAQDDELITDAHDVLRLAYECGSPVGASGFCLASSKDAGATWTQNVIVRMPADKLEGGFASIASDDAGTLYAAWADTRSGQRDLWLSDSADGATWSQATRVTATSGTHVFPWLAAGAPGRVAVGYYATPTVGDPNDHSAMDAAVWNADVAITMNALVPAPAWTSAVVGPAHNGTLATHGLIGPDASAPDRSLGDYLTIAADPQGRVQIAYVQASGGPGQVLHAIEDVGPRLRDR